MEGEGERSPLVSEKGRPAARTPEKAPSSDEMEGEVEKFSMSAMKQKLRNVGHDEREISEWKERTAAMSNALKKEGAANRVNGTGGAEGPTEMMMLDSGTFRHLAGRTAIKYMVGRREIKPFPVKTALGLAWITEECDLLIGSYLIERCLVNHNLNTTLLSEGLLSLEEPYWEFNRNRHGLDIVLGDGTKHQGYQKGVMYYLPQSLLDLKKEGSTQGVTVTPNRAMEGTEEADYYESINHMMSPQNQRQSAIRESRIGRLITGSKESREQTRATR